MSAHAFLRILAFLEHHNANQMPALKFIRFRLQMK
jgi:hypothetical protein